MGHAVLFAIIAFTGGFVSDDAARSCAGATDTVLSEVEHICPVVPDWSNLNE